MPGLGAKLRLGGWAGSDQGYQSPVTNTMYGPTGAGPGAAMPGTHVITGELLALVVLELVLLGWIRLSFRHHFGG
jgi:hypothetical protein